MIAIRQESAEEVPAVLHNARTEIADRARRTAEECRATEIDEDVVAELENEARGVAHGLSRTPFAPDVNGEDEFRRSQDDDDRRLQHEADDAEAFALGIVDQRRDALAALPPAGQEPSPSTLGAASAAALIAISLGVVFHDRFFGDGMDWLIRWITSLLLGLVPGLLVVAFMLSDYRSERRTSRQWLGLGSGVAIGIGAFLLRISDAASSDIVLVASGLSLLELSAIGFMDFHVGRVREEYGSWRKRSADRETASHLVQQAERAHSERGQRLASIRQRREEYQRHLEERRARALPLERLQEILVSAVRPAYAAGIAHNRSLRLGGQLRRVP